VTNSRWLPIQSVNRVLALTLTLNRTYEACNHSSIVTDRLGIPGTYQPNILTDGDLLHSSTQSIFDRPSFKPAFLSKRSYVKPGLGPHIGHGLQERINTLECTAVIR